MRRSCVRRAPHRCCGLKGLHRQDVQNFRFRRLYFLPAALRGKTGRIKKASLSYVLTVTAVFSLTLLLLTGCGSRQGELEAYQEKISGFGNAMADCQSQMDAIDVQEQDAEEELLSLIDQMATLCSDAASLTPPAGYEDAGEMCSRASDYLQEAKGSFHAAFASEPFDSAAWQQGLSSYQSAGRCLALMMDALQEPS